MYETAACLRAVYAPHDACQHFNPFARAQSSRYPAVAPRHREIKGRVEWHIIKLVIEDNI
jgi:hypothetical protein